MSVDHEQNLHIINRRFDSIVAALADVNIDEAVKADPVAVSAAPSAAQAGGGEKKEEAKEKEPSGKSEEQAMEGLSSLFG